MNQKGSILVYILIAIFLTGMLIASMTQGAKKSASSEQMNETMMYLQTDLRSIQANITECVVSYQNNNFCPPNNNLTGVSCVSQYGSVSTLGTPDYGNYNAPFPTPSTAAISAGTPLLNIVCPRAPSTPLIFTNNVSQSLKLLQDPANYTVTYYNNATDGVYLRITRAVTDPLWTEVLARLPSKYQSCSTVVEYTGSDPTGFNCAAAGGCLYYFIKRPGPGPGSPVLGTCP